MTTCRLTPICGAAMPAPFFERMVSSMSCSNACNSAVSNWVTGSARLNRMGSPILNTGLFIAFHQLLQQRAHLDHRCLQYRVDLIQMDLLAAVDTAGGVIHHHREGRVAHADFLRQ